MQSGGPESASPVTHRVQSLSSADTRGKHRIHAELKRLEQEARFLEEELEKLERMEKASTACKGLLSNVETKPDPLLPSAPKILKAAVDAGFSDEQC
ncbi:Guanine nucleotide-binding protein [Vigna angularis]|uniref:Guanine nucleotide-binding protein n=1 Tax=Phaseolus angularis TaxID=3914 RepID=A0A8T0KSJ6_PHAAN|nr:Guanine nucleotide-binding protein [Vigna angularis]